MGYYSFYKIIKDVIRTLFGSRIFKYFIIITIILLILFITSNNSYGAFYLDGFLYDLETSVEYSLPDSVSEYNYIVVIRQSSGTVNNGLRVYASNTKFYMRYDSENPRYKAFGFIEGNVDYAYAQTGQTPTNYDLSNVTLTTTTSAGLDSIKHFAAVQSANVAVGNDAHTAGFRVVASNYTIMDTDNNVVYEPPINFTYPYLTPSTTDIQDLNFDNLFVELGDYNLNDGPLYLHALQIINSVPENNEVLYYYSDNVFYLNKKSDYYHQFLDTTNYYFSIPKESINFGVDKSYLLVLTNKESLKMNSVGLYEKDEENGYYDVVLIDTSGIVSESEEINNNLHNLNNNINNINNNLNPNSPINQNVTTENQEEIDENLNFNNHNQQIEGINSNFLSRLLNLVSGLADYDTSTSYIDIPMPNSSKSLRLRSDIISAHVSDGLKNLISALWFYMFSFYMYSYINKIYIALSTGKIIETFTSKGEVITNDML